MNPQDGGGGPAANGTANHTTSPHHKDQVNTDRSGSTSSSTDTRAVSSQQVSWWDVHSYVTPVLEAAGSYPMVGTPEWCALDDTDRRKVVALFDAAQHWALRLETCQVAECEASHAISAAADWAAIAQHIRDRTQFYAERPWLKRTAS